MPELQINITHITSRGPSKWDLSVRFFDPYGSQKMVEFSNENPPFNRFMVSMTSIEKLDTTCERWIIRGTLTGVGLPHHRDEQNNLLSKKVEVRYDTNTRSGFLKFVQ